MNYIETLRFERNQIIANVTQLNFSVFSNIEYIALHGNEIYGTLHWINFPSTLQSLYIGSNEITYIDNSTYNKYYVKNVLTSIVVCHLSYQDYDMNFFEFWDLLPINDNIMTHLYLNSVTFAQGPSPLKWEYVENKFENITHSGTVSIYMTGMNWDGKLNLSKFPRNCRLLQLGNNNLYGELTNESIGIGHMTDLQHLQLNDNNFSGTVDWDMFATMTQLADFYLRFVLVLIQRIYHSLRFELCVFVIVIF